MNQEFIFILLTFLLIFGLIFFATYKLLNFKIEKHIVEIEEILLISEAILFRQNDVKAKVWSQPTEMAFLHPKIKLIQFDLGEIAVTKDALIIFGKKTFGFTRLTATIVLTLDTDKYSKILPAKNAFNPRFAQILKIDKLEFEAVNNSVCIETQVNETGYKYSLNIQLYGVNDNIKETLKSKILAE